jgi:hypothetical protein
VEQGRQFNKTAHSKSTIMLKNMPSARNHLMKNISQNSLLKHGWEQAVATATCLTLITGAHASVSPRRTL